jgi:hypothetical protein
MHCQGNHPNGLVPLKHWILARMAFFGQDNGGNGGAPIVEPPPGGENPDILAF